MKLLKTKKLVSFQGSTYSSEEARHLKLHHTAKLLNDSKYATYVQSLKLGSNDEGVYTTHDYYKCEHLLVSDKEYEELRSMGVDNLQVLGLYEDSLSTLATLSFYIAIATFTSWNIAALIKYLGLL